MSLRTATYSLRRRPLSAPPLGETGGTHDRHPPTGTGLLIDSQPPRGWLRWKSRRSRECPTRAFREEPLIALQCLRQLDVLAGKLRFRSQFLSRAPHYARSMVPHICFKSRVDFTAHAGPQPLLMFYVTPAPIVVVPPASQRRAKIDIITEEDASLQRLQTSPNPTD